LEPFIIHAEGIFEWFMDCENVNKG